MGVLTKGQLLAKISTDNLIVEVRLDGNNIPLVEGASYDLSVGTIIWKDSEKKDVHTLHYDPSIPAANQETTTLQPGQMLFVVTKEELNMPLDLSATVFSRNQLSRDGILALNTGHVDPGYSGPIIIRLINLRAIPYTLKLGTPIYTVVFQKLSQPIDPSLRHPPVSRADSIAKATKSVDEALSNALYDLALLNSFIKKDEFGPLFWKWVKSNTLKFFGLLIAVIVFAATVISAIPALIDLIKVFFNKK